MGVLEEAAKEIALERHREAVEFEKMRLRLRRNLWVRLFPWRLVRRDQISGTSRADLVGELDRLTRALGWIDLDYKNHGHYETFTMTRYK